MNYFEIFNKVLLELNYRPIQTFRSIYQSGHKKILEAINRVNNEVLASYDWEFLDRQTVLSAPEGIKAFELPFSGDIKAVYHARTRLSYTPHYEEILTGRLEGDLYSVANGRIIFPKKPQDVNYRIFYLSKSYAVSEKSQFKEKLEDETDCSVIPMPFAEHILVYGACLKVKANPAYPKFAFWNTMYIQALANLRQKSPRTKEGGPCIKIG